MLNHLKNGVAVAKRSLHLLISGRVQGVGFRAFVRREALARKISGWVRNRRDGSVEIVLSGDVDAVEAVVAVCRAGPHSAAIEDVTISEQSAPVLSGFAELPTE